MFPDLEFIKTALNAIMFRFRNVQANVDAVQANVDAVQANVDAVQANVDAVQANVERQPDFDEYDSTSHAYIKNKPCYDYVEPNVVIWESNSAGISGQGSLTLISDMGDRSLIEGSEYILTVNGVSSAYTCQTDSYGCLLFGGDKYTNSIYQRTDIVTGITGLYAFTTEFWASGDAVKLEGPLRRYKKVDAEFYDAVTSVNGETGDVEITPEGIGASKIENIFRSNVIHNSIVGRIDDRVSDSIFLGTYSSGFKGGLISMDGAIMFWSLTVLKNVNTPVNNTDAANKAYVDASVSSARDYIILNSSTEDSTKQFKITVDDSGTLTATEVTE